MRTLGVILLLNVINLCSFEHIWHPYQYDPIHQSREELLITNLTSDESFTLDYLVKEWKSLCVEKKCYMVGLMEKKLVVVSLELNSTKTGFVPNSYTIEFEKNPVDVDVFHHWNRSSLIYDVFFVVATQDSDSISWFKVFDQTHFWAWSLSKTISHVDMFEINHDHHILLMTQNLGRTTADLYEFNIDEQNFWLRENIELEEQARSSAVVNFGPDVYLAIPQTSLNLLLVYKLSKNRFLSYRNISSIKVDQVVSYKIGHKPFLSFNGFNAGIYRFEKNGLVREEVSNSQLDGVNFWLPVTFGLYHDDQILIAQRSLHHGGHKSFVIEMITYNGDQFEEHEDMSCLYFGETVMGLSCLPDGESEIGIEGSTSVLLDDVLALVVPRTSRMSDVFFVQTKLRKVDNPVLKQIEEFVSRRQYIEKLIKTEEEKFKSYVAAPRQVIDLDQIRAELDEMEQEVESMQDDDSTHFSTIVFENDVKVTSVTNFQEVEAQQIDNFDASSVLQDIVLKNNVNHIPSTKIVTNLQVEDLFVDQIDGIASKNLLFSSDHLNVDGNLRLEQPLLVSEDVTAEQVNGVIFQNEVVSLDSPVHELVFDNVEVAGGVSVNRINEFELGINPERSHYSELSVPLSLQVVNVNGENFNQFLHQLCLTNLNCNIPGSVTVDGDVLAGEAATDFLNQVKFPSEYVFTHESSPAITGRKEFISLTSPEVIVEGTVDGILSRDIITLSTDQNLPNTTTFKSLKITEGLNVSGKISGEHASKFLPNPTLLDTNVVKAKVHFKELEVEGSIIVSDSYNGETFEAVLSDVIYSDEDSVLVEGIKQFPEGLTVRKNLLIESNGINNISLDSIVSKDTDQKLNISQIKGVVNFGNVETDLLYNSADVKQLDEELVKLNGEQYISACLIFEDGLSANEMEVTKNYNMSRQPLGDVIVAERVTVEGNVTGDLKYFDLKSFESRRLSTSREQDIDAEYSVEKSFISRIRPNKINDHKPFDLTRESKTQTLVKKLQSGRLEVENLFATSVEMETFDSNPTISLEGNVWKNGKKYNITNLVFNDDVHFDSIEIDKFSGVNFTRFVQNIVFKNDSDVRISGFKTFAQGLTIGKLLETKRLNHVLLENILSKYGAQEVCGSITIHGDVSFPNISISETINDIPITMIGESFQPFEDHFQINGDVLFNRLPHIYNLQIEGQCMDKNMSELLDAIVYKNQDSNLEGLISFQDKIKVEKNIRVVGQINGVDLGAFAAEVVWATKDTKIEGDIEFEDSVCILDKLTVAKNLNTETLNDVDLKSMLEDAVFINKGFLKGNYTFEDVTIVDRLDAQFIDNLDTNFLIPLRSEQNLSGLSFERVSLFKDVDAGSVNSHNLSAEFENSVLIHLDQEVDSEVEFLGNVFVSGDLELEGLLNEMQPDLVVTTSTDQELEATYSFKAKTSFEKNMQVDGLVNWINITKWQDEVVLVSSQNAQIVDRNWSVQQDLVFEDDTQGFGLINGLDIKELSQEVVDKRNYKYLIEKGFIDDYNNMCKDLTFMYQKIKKQVYKFDYLEDLQAMSFQNHVEFIHTFKFNNNLYLIIQERKSCDSFLLMFDSQFRFVKFINFGLVGQIVSVLDAKSFYLVVRNVPSLCKVQGTNIWKMDENGLAFTRLVKMEDQDLLQESLKPRTFYGLSGSTVTEFKLFADLKQVMKYRKWKLPDDGFVFVPRGLATGLAMRNGRMLLKLLQEDESINEFDHNFESIIVGNYTVEHAVLPGSKNNDLVVMGVGVRGGRRKLLAVATHEESSVDGSLDFIKIYEDITSDKLFHRVETYKPSSLISIEFNNGETLLAFLEDGNVLQVYEYKGIEGFKHRMSVKTPGSKLIHMSTNKGNIVGVVNKNQINFMEAVMLGHRVEDNLQCTL